MHACQVYNNSHGTCNWSFICFNFSQFIMSNPLPEWQCIVNIERKNQGIILSAAWAEILNAWLRWMSLQCKYYSINLRLISLLSFARSWPSTAASTIIIINRIKIKTARTISLVLFKNNPPKTPDVFTFGSPSTSSCCRGISASFSHSAITCLWKRLAIKNCTL